VKTKGKEREGGARRSPEHKQKKIEGGHEQREEEGAEAPHLCFGWIEIVPLVHHSFLASNLTQGIH